VGVGSLDQKPSRLSDLLTLCAAEA
jgi:hypothetical protein